MKWIVAFDDEATPDRARLGDKGAGLVEMTRLGLPVPPGFTIVTEACAAYLGQSNTWPAQLGDELSEAIERLEAATERRFGDSDNPLLVSVRSGAEVSMPGMMDTVLNVGLNRSTTEALAAKTGNAAFAWDSYRRFVQMFGDVVLGVHYTRFHRAQEAFLAGRAIESLSVDELKGLCDRLEQEVTAQGLAFPADPREQLKLAIEAVFRSFNSHRARYYRKSQGLEDALGTAVNVQQMVFGNMGADSGTGVAFTRNPNTGEPGLFGEWLPNAQGEDVVSGTHTPFPLSGAGEPEAPSLESAMPQVHAELRELQAKLESHFRDMQDIEFTVEAGRLFVLQTRRGKRTGQAAVQIVVDLVQEGLIDKREALLRLEPRELEYVLRPVLRPDAQRKIIAKGLDASPGAATGKVVFTPSDAQDFFDRDEPTILVRLETSPEDIQGMTVAAGVLTARGGQTSHAAVVARGMGKPCVVGATEIQVDYARELFYAGDSVIRKGDWITIDGGTGEIMEGRVEMLAPQTDSGAMATLLGWADETARLKVRANADTGTDAERARQLGATGIGLCRTEHMFFQPAALRAIRQMILADDPRSRKRALNDILPLQRSMFRELFQAMDGLPVTIRLLDPPLHEFLPDHDTDVADVAAELGVRPETMKARLMQLREVNPMLGHRGVRVGITQPEVYQTQVRAIFEAACEATRDDGVTVVPEVMVPLVGAAQELERVRTLVIDTAEAVMAEYGAGLSYSVGSMIEVPRAAMTADAIAEYADFFSFGTNDLTMMTYGFSRDDMGKFFADYQRDGILPVSPLTTFDVDGVGQMVRVAIDKARPSKPGLVLGACGEHAGDPHGVTFFHSVGVDYVSCSPYRVPVARLAAAQAALRDEG
ncbi:MAG: pyruvate, phosphate dikinase [Myxococcota bacterium]